MRHEERPEFYRKFPGRISTFLWHINRQNLRKFSKRPKYVVLNAELNSTFTLKCKISSQNFDHTGNERPFVGRGEIAAPPGKDDLVHWKSFLPITLRYLHINELTTGGGGGFSTQRYEFEEAESPAGGWVTELPTRSPHQSSLSPGGA